MGARVSVSSLRVDNLAPELLQVLSRGGTRTVTLAPEAGSERMRVRINKAVSEQQIIDAAEKVGAAAMRRLKLYFMIGLPDEEDEDVIQMAQLGAEIKQRLDTAGHGTELVMSVGPLVPKPATAYQELAQSSAKLVRDRQRILENAFRGTGIRLRGDSPTWARIDDICSRSDQRLAHAILEMERPSAGEWFPRQPRMGTRRRAALGRRTRPLDGRRNRHHRPLLRARVEQAHPPQVHHRLPTTRDRLQPLRRLRRRTHPLLRPRGDAGPARSARPSDQLRAGVSAW